MDDLRDAVLAAQCLDRRLPTLATVRAEVTAWQDQRNDAGATVAWQFTTDAARTKLHRLSTLARTPNDQRGGPLVGSQGTTDGKSDSG